MAKAAATAGAAQRQEPGGADGEDAGAPIGRRITTTTSSRRSRPGWRWSAPRSSRFAHGNVNLRDAYARAENGEIWLWNAHIAPFDQGNRWNHEPRRPRQLLLHTREIGRLASKSKESASRSCRCGCMTSSGKFKLEMALGKGKRQYDKRAAIAERESKREIERAIKEAYGRR